MAGRVLRLPGRMFQKGSGQQFDKSNEKRTIKQLACCVQVKRESPPLLLACSHFPSRHRWALEWYLQPGSWSGKTSSRHENKDRRKHQWNQRFKLFHVKWPLCSGCIPDVLYSCKLSSSSSQHQPCDKWNTVETRSPPTQMRTCA